MLGGAGYDLFYILNVAAPTWFDLVAHEFEWAMVFSIDLTPEPWLTRTDYHDENGQLFRSDVFYDDRSGATALFDIADHEAWSAAITFANRAGQVTHQSVANDDGTSLNTYFDADNIQSWRQAPIYYDVAGFITQ